MSNVMLTISAIASGVASVAAIAGFYMAAPAVAFVAAQPAVEEPKGGQTKRGPIGRLVDAFDRSMRRQQTIEAMLSLDDRLLRDIGLMRAILGSMNSREGRARGLYSEMIQHRLRRF